MIQVGRERRLLSHALLRLPPIENNVAVGLVIKLDQRAPAGQRVSFKRKLEEFNEGRFDESERLVNPQALIASGDAEATGSVKRKVEPSPGVLSTQMRPPWASTRPLQMASPRPAPRLSRASACQKRSNTRS